MSLPSHEQFQYEVYTGLSFGILALTTLAYFLWPLLFQRFLGRFNPLLAVPLVALLGAASFAVLLKRGWFAVLAAGNPTRFLILALLAALMALSMILLDLRVHFPRDMNVPFPGSLFFYPVIAYIVDIALHVVPLTILLLIGSSLFKGADFNAVLWISILVVALIEPILQIGLGWPPFVALQILIFNIIELALFRRYDFITMYSFRLFYYLLWHILWGHLRLALLAATGTLWSL